MTALSTVPAAINADPSPPGESSLCITMQSAAAVDSPSEAYARRAAERAEDAEDARHKRAASPTPWQALGLDPDPKRSPGRSVVNELGTLRWQDEAACRDVPPDDAEAFTEVRTQDEAEPLVSTYCSTCPVRLRCLAEGRALRGWGVFGGVALVDGLRARECGQQQPRGGQSATPARAWLVAALAEGPRRRVDLIAAASEAGIGSRTLDSAARARGVVSTRRPGDPGAWWSLPGDVNAEAEVSTDEPEVEPSEADEVALWLIDHLAERGPQRRVDVLGTANHGPAAVLAGAVLLDLDTEADCWELP